MSDVMPTPWLDPLGRPLADPTGKPWSCGSYPLCCPLREEELAECPCFQQGKSAPDASCCPFLAGESELPPCCGPCALERPESSADSSGSASAGSDLPESSAPPEPESGSASGSLPATEPPASSLPPESESESGAASATEPPESSRPPESPESSAGLPEVSWSENLSEGNPGNRYSAYFALCYWRLDEQGQRYRCRVDLVRAYVWVPTGELSFLGVPPGLKVGEELVLSNGDHLLATQVPPGTEYRFYGWNGINLELLLQNAGYSYGQLLELARAACGCVQPVVRGILEVRQLTLSYVPDTMRYEEYEECSDVCREWDDQGNCLRTEPECQLQIGGFLGNFAVWSVNGEERLYLLSDQSFGQGDCLAYYRNCEAAVAEVNADFDRVRRDRQHFLSAGTSERVGSGDWTTISSGYRGYGVWNKYCRYLRLRVEKDAASDPESVGVRLRIDARITSHDGEGAAESALPEVELFANRLVTLRYGETLETPILDNLAAFAPDSTVESYCAGDSWHDGWFYTVSPRGGYGETPVQSLYFQYETVSYLYD